MSNKNWFEIGSRFIKIDYNSVHPPIPLTVYHTFRGLIQYKGQRVIPTVTREGSKICSQTN